MQCSRCRHENRSKAKFCQECGAALTLFEAPANPNDAAAPDPVAMAGDRRQVAILFADISGYTAQCARSDPEEIQAMLGRFFDAMDTVVEGYGGQVFDRAGDAVMAVFGAPKAHGNDAQRAIRAGLDMHAAAARLIDCDGQPLCLHIGVASGEVVAAVISGGGKAKYSVTGDAVNLAARLDALASAGETLISDALYRSVCAVVDAQAMGECAVKGFAVPVPVWKVRALRAAGAERSPFVGRRVELTQLVDALDGVRVTQTGTTIVLRGDAGIGKSRLVEELRTRAKLQGFDVPLGQVLDFGVGKGQDAVPTVLKWVLEMPVSDDEPARRLALRRALDSGLIAGDEEVFVNDLLDVDQPAPLKAIFDALDHATRLRRSGETFAAVLRRAAALRPLLVTIEDLHWASADLLRHVAALAVAAAQSPMILIVTARAEADPSDGSWLASVPGHAVLTIDLAPLPAQESQLLARELVEAWSEFASNCIERAEGNPLFLEQLLRGSHASAQQRVPATIQSLILERMDRLSARDRVALQAASVLGKRFSQKDLHAIGEPHDGCDALVAADMIRPDGIEYSFAHALIQEAVYASTLKSKRRELHRRAARWFGQGEPVLRAEHLDRAEDAEAAQAYLIASRQEAGRFRFDSALRLVERASEIASTPTVACAVALLRGEILRETGRSKESIVAFRYALDLAEEGALRCRAWMGIAAGHRVTGELALAMEALGQAQPIAEQLHLAVECSRIHHTRGNLHFAQGDVQSCAAEHRQALEMAQRSGNAECEAHALGGIADANYAQGRMLTALTYFRRCIEMCAEHGWIGVEISNRCMAAVCLWYQGALDEGILELRRACADAQRVGMVPARIMALDTLAILLSEAGHFDETEEVCMRGLALARPAGSRRYESLLLWNLANVHLARGDLAEAAKQLTAALELARETGLGSLGPAIYGRLARTAQGAAERAQALGNGEALLKEPCLAHAPLGFYRDAIEATLAVGDWERTLRYAAALEEFVSAEPLPWALLVVARARALRDAATGADRQEVAWRLSRLREEVVAAGWGSALPAIDALSTRLQAGAP